MGPSMSSSVWSRLEPHLAAAKSPSQYVGGEWNSVRKDWDACPTRFLIAFPDAYTIGMSHLGLHILYSMLNGMPGVLCERAFNPWVDVEASMRREGIPLFSVDSHRPARDFDMIGISLQSEMGYSNVLALLDLAGIPLLAAERGKGDPIVLGGGPNASFPEPVAEFFDLLILGDGEETTVAFVELHRRMKAEGASRGEILREAALRVPGAYVPGLYRFDPRTGAVSPLEGIPARVCKANVPNLETAFYPLRPIVPHSEVVFDRINLEIMRGCPHRCRFCHAVSFKNKLRFRRADLLVDWAEKLYAATGHDEISLISLSSGDHPQIQELMTRLNDRFLDRRVTIALPSLRVDGKLKELPRLVRSGRRGGFTVAPEAGTEAFRQVIRKPILDQDLFDTARAAFEEGFTHLKLYFMIGLPRETDEDIEGIVRTARECARIGRETRRRHTEINVTISPFVPKPHTPFQFAPFAEFDYFDDVTARLRSNARGSPVRLKIHNPRESYVQAVLARGDRRLSGALREAVRLGCKFDEWSEFYSLPRWMQAFENAGIDPDAYARRTFGLDDPLPWDHLDVGTSKKYLWDELRYCHERADQREAGTIPAAVR
jgi:radical SAM family uncharacterized protein